MRRLRFFLAALALALPLATCSKGSECDVCKTDTDCKDGFVCSHFQDPSGGDAGFRCGSGIGATQCRVR